MGFWIFKLIMNLLIPVSMIAFGFYFTKHAPKKINAVFGYRTIRSMKNKETWQFAHQYFGKLWLKLGWIVLIVSIITMCLLLHKTEELISNTSLILMLFQLVFLLYPIFPTERALKNTFDQDGHRK